MIRVNIVLSMVLMICALALVTAQHEGRQLFSEFTKEQESAKQVDVEWGQLQLEQSTWAMHARIEKIASGYLRMRLPAAAQVRFVSPRSAAAASTRPGIRSKKRP